MSYASDVAAANDALVKAQADLATAQSTAQSVAASVTAAEAAVAQAQAALDVAVRNAQTANSAVASAQNMVTQAQSHLDYLLANPPVTLPTHALLGMSAPTDKWAQRSAEVGPGLQARRIFLQNLTDFPSRISEAVAAGQLPVISLKVPSWASMATSQYDPQLRSFAAKLRALNFEVMVAFHHEPAKSGHPPVGEAGTPAQWAAMQRRALPLMKAEVGPKLSTMVIGNGWWWNSNNQRYSDAELKQWIPDDVRKMVDVVAADTYQMAPGDEEPASKMRNMVAWAKRMGDVKGLGIGEFNSHTATGIADACAVLKAEPLFKVGCVWNTDEGTAVKVLTGTRLTAFKTALSNW